MSIRKIIVLLILLFSSNIVSASTKEFDDFFSGLMKREGVTFTFAKFDRGGPTKFGVTLNTYIEWSKNKNIKEVDKDSDNKITANDIRLLTINDVKSIYRVRYWNYWKSDSIDKFKVKSSLVDFLVNSGVGKNSIHIKSIQKLVGVTSDGVVGMRTIYSINRKEEKQMLIIIYNYRISFIDRIIRKDPSQKIYEKGWKKRVTYFLN